MGRRTLAALVFVQLLTLPFLTAAFSQNDAGNAGPLVTVIYDVTDLVQTPRNFPAPRLGLDDGSVKLTPQQEEQNDSGWTAEQLAELIRQSIQPGSWSKTASSVKVVGAGQLCIELPRSRQKMVAGLLTRLRTAKTETFTIHVREVEGSTAAVKSVGVDTSDARLAQRLSGHDALVRLHELERSGDLVETAAPMVIVRAGQKAQVSQVEQKPYVSRYEQKDGIVDPVVDTLCPGVTAELSIRRVAPEKAPSADTAGDVLLTWKVTVARAPVKFQKTKIDGREIELPQMRSVVSEGSNVLRPGQILAIHGFPARTAGSNGEQMMILLSWETGKGGASRPL